MGYFGSSALSGIKLGSSDVLKAYHGTNLLWEPPATPSVFSLATYAGNSATQSITGVGFEPGMMWISANTGGLSRGFNVFDKRRGVGKYWTTHVVGQEVTNANSLTSFDSDGFSISTDNNINLSGRGYEAYCWGGLGSASTNSNGTITTTVQVSASAGFSVFSYNGNWTANATVGHGLSSAPEWVVIGIKCCEGRATYASSSLIGTNLDWALNSTTAATSNTQYIRSVNSSTITLGGDIATNGPSNYSYIGYAFTSVPGVSKIGLATGDGSGVLSIDTGFSPRLIVIKTYIGTGNWLVCRRTNDTTGYVTQTYMNSSVARSVSTEIQITSNGFSIDPGGDGNVSGSTESIWYMAYA